MPLHSIDALLDASADAAVRAEWATLAAARLPSRADHRGASNAPHVTLAAARVITGETDAALGRRLAGLLPVHVRIGELLVLGNARHVLARRVDPTPQLLALHRAVVDGLEDAVGPAEWPRPPLWVPHVTLSGRLDADQLRAAREALGELRPVDAEIVSVRRWDAVTGSVHPLAP
jgi:2'-5' RNA ligase